jgi:hypothetical protein
LKMVIFYSYVNVYQRIVLNMTNSDIASYVGPGAVTAEFFFPSTKRRFSGVKSRGTRLPLFHLLLYLKGVKR